MNKKRNYCLRFCRDGNQVVLSTEPYTSMPLRATRVQSGMSVGRCRDKLGLEVQLREIS